MTLFHTSLIKGKRFELVLSVSVFGLAVMFDEDEISIILLMYMLTIKKKENEPRTP